jgi:glycerate 2-kinase
MLGLLHAALSAVDGRRCVRDALCAAAVGAAREPVQGPVWLAAVGKAAAAMTLGAHDVLGARIERALVITRSGHIASDLEALTGIEIVTGAHPVPDARSLVAGERLLEWVEGLPGAVQPLFLISGGASSLTEVPVSGTTLADLESFTSRALASGIAIGELNAQRIARSAIKGGKLTARLRGRPAQALFVSDVPGDDPGVIGSGLLGPANAGPDRVRRTIVASIGQAVEAARTAAAARGLTVHPPTARFDASAGRVAARCAHELLLSAAQACVWGGESTVQLPPHPGRGGRNQHLALTAAKLIAGQPELMLLAAGTDGTDGVTEDAGALVDADSCARVALSGLDVDQCLAQADSAGALGASGDLVHTGPTGTNVGDLVIGLKLSAAAARELEAARGGTRSRVL